MDTDKKPFINPLNAFMKEMDKRIAEAGEMLQYYSAKKNAYVDAKSILENFLKEAMENIPSNKEIDKLFEVLNKVADEMNNQNGSMN